MALMNHGEFVAQSPLDQSIGFDRLCIQPLFPVALGHVQLHPDPLDLALQLQALLTLRGDSCSNPEPGCAWTGDLNGVWQLHRHPTFSSLVRVLSTHAHRYLAELGFDRSRCTLHLQRCWPVVSEPDQVVGRHHHPNAHLSAVYYFNGDGSGRQGCLRLFPSRQSNELVPGMGLGHGAPMARSSWTVPWMDLAPQAGLLLLFPASLDHAVLPNEAEDDLRFSMSMDFVISSVPGSSPPEYLAPHPRDWQEV